MKNLQLIGCKPHLIPHCENALMSINVDNGLVYFVSSLQFIEYNPISLKVCGNKNIRMMKILPSIIHFSIFRLILHFLWMN